MITIENIKISKGVEDLRVTIEHLDDESVIYFVENSPICCFDQHSRARVGVTFYDYHVSDDPFYIFYSNVYEMLINNEDFKNKVIDTLKRLEVIRSEQSLPTSFNLMTRSCSYRVKQNFNSLKGQMMRRLKFCEEEFVVGLHWLLRDKLIKLNVELAKNFLPGCDLIKECDYSSADYLSNMFGNLFAGCNRWEDKSNFATFNESCTNVLELEKQLNINIPRSEYDFHK